MSTVEDRTIPPRSQALVHISSHPDDNQKWNSDSIMLEPFKQTNRDFLVACSIHSPLEKSFCNVINASDEPLILKKGHDIGIMTEAEINEKFDDDVLLFNPLDIVHASNSEPGHLYDHSTPIVEEPSASLDLNKIVMGNQLTLSQKNQLLEVVKHNHSSFQWDPTQLSRTRLVEHAIPTGNHPPIRQKQYSIPSVAREPMIEQVNEMLSVDAIRPSKSPWCSPILLVKKQLANNMVKHRFCINLKKVNDITVKDCYSLPHISSTNEALAGSKYLSTADVDRAFWQIGVREEDKPKLAFCVDGKLYEPNCMPFGSMNAPSTFQRLVDRVFQGLTWKQCLVYIDDILIFSKTFEQHLVDVDEVLSRLRFAGLKLKPSKCHFGCNEVEYLGFKISSDGVKPTDKRIELVLNTPPPETTKQLVSFLASMNFYRSCIPRYGYITVELYKLANSNKKFCKWTDVSRKNFQELKEALVSAPVLIFPDYNQPFSIQSDASSLAIGAVLLQKVENQLRPVSFASRKLTSTETRYSTTERELLAIVFAYKQFYSHVYGREVTFFTDHEPLVTLNKLKFPHGRLGRLLFHLQGVNCSFEYIPGNKNFLPDFLSRMPDPDSEEAKVHFTQVASTIDWITEQIKDPEIAEIINLVNSSADDTSWTEVTNGKRWLHEKKRLYIADSILKHGPNRIVVPEALKSTIMKLHHDSPLAGHRAFETTYWSIRNRFHWNCMSRDVKNYCESCTLCQQYNYSCLKGRAPLKSIQVSRPWQLLGIDVMGPFKISKFGNKFIIVAIDHYTKYAEAIATSTFNGFVTAVFIFNQIICRYGMVEKILTDQGVNFESNLFKQLCALIGTKKLRTSTYHAMANGITERLNKNIKPSLAKFVNDQHDDWDLFLPMAMSAYNTSYHSSIGMTPYQAQFGRRPVLVADTILNNQLPEDTKLKDIAEFTKALQSSASRITDTINEHASAARAKQKLNYDRFVQDSKLFKEGDTVKINNYYQKTGLSKAFSPKFKGPYTITKCIGDLNFSLHSPHLKPELVHYNRMAKFYNRIPSDTPSHFDASPVLVEDLVKPSNKLNYQNLSDDESFSEFLSNIILRKSKRKKKPAVSQPVLDYLTLNSLFSSDNSDDNTNSDLEVAIYRTNEKGKPTVQCNFCQGWYEATHGIKVHMTACKRKNSNID